MLQDDNTTRYAELLHFRLKALFFSTGQPSLAFSCHLLTSWETHPAWQHWELAYLPCSNFLRNKWMKGLIRQRLFLLLVSPFSFFFFFFLVIHKTKHKCLTNLDWNEPDILQCVEWAINYGTYSFSTLHFHFNCSAMRVFHSYCNSNDYRLL